MPITGKVLYLAGFTFGFSSSLTPDPLDIEEGINGTFVAIPHYRKRETPKRRVLRITYESLIASIMIWTVIYAVYMSIRDKSIYSVGRSLFQVSYSIQYYYAIAYFGKNHFYENITCNKNLRRYVSIAIPIMFLFSLLIASINVALLNLSFRFNVYDELINFDSYVSRILISALLFVDSLYSYLTFTITAVVFAINMIYHKRTVSKYASDLETYVRQNMNTIKKLNVIAIDYAQMKTNWNDTVELMTPFFSTLNFVGFIALYFYSYALNNGGMGVPEWINMFLFIIIEIIYLISIRAVNDNVSQVNDTLNSNSMIYTFFSNKNFNHNVSPSTHSKNHRTGIIDNNNDIDLNDIIRHVSDDDFDNYNINQSDEINGQTDGVEIDGVEIDGIEIDGIEMDDIGKFEDNGKLEDIGRNDNNEKSQVNGNIGNITKSKRKLGDINMTFGTSLRNINTSTDSGNINEYHRNTLKRKTMNPRQNIMAFQNKTKSNMINSNIMKSNIMKSNMMKSNMRSSNNIKNSTTGNNVPNSGMGYNHSIISNDDNSITNNDEFDPNELRHKSPEIISERDYANEFMNDNDENNNTADYTSEIIIEQLNMIHNLSRHAVISSVSNQLMLDWMSLRDITQTQWETFKIFGVEITDSTLISRLVGIVIAVLVSTELGSLFNWW